MKNNDKDSFRKPKISIVTPSLNQGRYIEQTILSVIGQDYSNYEYMIFDGGSKDSTCEIIKKYEDRIDFWVSEQDKGQSDAINKGLARVDGDIVAWLNSDDQYYSTDIFNKVARFFELNPKVDACYGDNIYVDKDSTLLYMRRAFPFFSRGLLSAWNYIHQPTVFMRRRVIEEFILDPEIEYIMDYEFWLRISKKFHFKYLDTIVSASRWHDDCKTMGGEDVFFKELKLVHDADGAGVLQRIISPRYIFKFFYNLQRLLTLPYLLRLKGIQRFSNITIGSWISLLKRQVFGLRFGS